MSRVVERDENGPLKLDESDIDHEKGDVAVCQCGLSAAYPFCDGTHRRTTGEDDDATYRYVREDGELVRFEVDRVVTVPESREVVASDED